MHDKLRILAGLAVALVVLALPFWYALAGGNTAPPPALPLPKNCPRCVEDTPYMRAHHTDLLRQWRDSVVRDGNKTYVSKTYGTSCEMSLTKTCMRCHTDRQTFCDRCHAYANVRPTCWGCHVEPREK